MSPALSDFVKGAAYFCMELERAIELVLLERSKTAIRQLIKRSNCFVYDTAGAVNSHYLLD